MAEIKMSNSCAGKVTGETSTVLHPAWRKTDVYEEIPRRQMRGQEEVLHQERALSLREGC